MALAAALESLVDRYGSYPLMTRARFRADVAARVDDLLRYRETRQGRMDEVFRSAYVAALRDYLRANT